MTGLVILGLAALLLIALSLNVLQYERIGDLDRRLWDAEEQVHTLGGVPGAWAEGGQAATGGRDGAAVLRAMRGER